MVNCVKIYVITVCLNAKAALDVSLQSINALRSPDIYYFISDGNSCDGTKQYLEECGSLVDQWVSESDNGIYDAMNKAVARLPAGDGHVLFLGAGDRLLDIPDKTERQLGAILFGDVQIGAEVFMSKIGWKLKAGNTLHHQGIFYPKTLLMAFPFDTRFKIYADFDLNQRLSIEKIPFLRLDRKIAFAEPGGVSWGAPPSEMIAITQKNFGVFWAGVARLWIAYRWARSQITRADW